jgi:hypothetical protein
MTDRCVDCRRVMSIVRPTHRYDSDTVEQRAWELTLVARSNTPVRWCRICSILPTLPYSHHTRLSDVCQVCIAEVESRPRENRGGDGCFKRAPMTTSRHRTSGATCGGKRHLLADSRTGGHIAPTGKRDGGRRPGCRATSPAALYCAEHNRRSWLRATWPAVRTATNLALPSSNHDTSSSVIVWSGGKAGVITYYGGSMWMM